MTVHKRLADFLGEKWVLVVEPANNYKASIKQFLSNLKLTKNVKTVSTAAEARRELLTTRVGMVIAEWNLADQNGIQLFRALRKDPLVKNAIFLLLSVENQRKDVVLASESSIDGYLLKPFSYEDFVAQIDKLLQRRAAPSAHSVMLEEAEERYRLGQFDDAARLFEEARQIKGDSAKALVGLGRVAQRRGQFDVAADHLVAAITANSDFIDGYRALIELYDQTHNHAGLLKTALMAHAKSPDNPRYVLFVAQAYLEMDNAPSAEDYFRRAIRLSPKLAEAHKGLGDVFMIQEDYEKAMACYSKALDLDAEDISTLNSMGLALVRQGQIPEGIKKYRLALAIAPKDPRVLFNLGFAYEKSSDPERAEYYYQQAVTVDHTMQKAVKALERVRAARKGDV